MCSVSPLQQSCTCAVCSASLWLVSCWAPCKFMLSDYACRCRTDVARVERISCEQGLFISPATLQGFKSKSCMPACSKGCTASVTPLVVASAECCAAWLHLSHTCLSTSHSGWRQMLNHLQQCIAFACFTGTTLIGLCFCSRAGAC